MLKNRCLSLVSISNPFTYTSREFDPETGLYYFRARYYDPDTGRFLRQDPVFALNLYPYANGDPVNNTDPLGLLVADFFVQEKALQFTFTIGTVGGEYKSDKIPFDSRKRGVLSYFGSIPTNFDFSICDVNDDGRGNNGSHQRVESGIIPDDMRPILEGELNDHKKSLKGYRYQMTCVGVREKRSIGMPGLGSNNKEGCKDLYCMLKCDGSDPGCKTGGSGIGDTPYCKENPLSVWCMLLGGGSSDSSGPNDKKKPDVTGHDPSTWDEGRDSCDSFYGYYENSGNGKYPPIAKTACNFFPEGHGTTSNCIRACLQDYYEEADHKIVGSIIADHMRCFLVCGNAYAPALDENLQEPFDANFY